jgi:hypothetical protein
MNMIESSVYFFLVKTAINITENDYQYFRRNCCMDIFDKRFRINVS